MSGRTFTIAALSWASPLTTERCLASWAPLASHKRCIQRLIWFQERTAEETALAQRHSFEALGDKDNIGIGPAYRELLDRADGSFLIFLECDWQLVHPRWVAKQIEAAITVVEDDVAALVRLRSTRRPGWPVNPSQFQNRELEYPYWLIESAYWEPHPERIFPSHLSTQTLGGERWLVASARYAGWSNNPHIAWTEWLTKEVRPFTVGTGKDFEGSIDRYWEQLPVNVAQGRGLFKHARIDGPGYHRRPLHHRLAYQPRLYLRRYLRRFVAGSSSARS